MRSVELPNLVFSIGSAEGKKGPSGKGWKRRARGEGSGSSSGQKGVMVDIELGK